MSVYVDKMRAGFRGMVMRHMLADSTDELLAMADKIGVQHKWLQCPGTWKEHFDVCLSKRALAVKHGARELGSEELGPLLLQRKRKALRPEGGVCDCGYYTGSSPTCCKCKKPLPKLRL